MSLVIEQKSKNRIEKYQAKIERYSEVAKNRGVDLNLDLYLLAYLEVIKDLSQFQKEQNKPFNPELLGFTKNADEKLLKFISNNNCYKIFSEDGFYVLRKNHHNIYTGYIPSQSFGVELLRNLEVIE
jgi:hypothetical protein